MTTVDPTAGIAAASSCSVKESLIVANPASSLTAIPSIRRRLYGLCVVVSLAVLLLIHLNNSSLLQVNAYVPLIVATMLAIGLAGAEWEVALQRHAAERQARLAELERSEFHAVERQRTFNRLWQVLADSRGKASLPAEALDMLAQLFGADLVAVWSVTEESEAFRLRGVQPAEAANASRLEKIAQASPCFERLRGVQRDLHVTNFARETSQALGLFCEERNLQEAMLCPVLVRQEMVGVLAFFYQGKPELSAKVREELQSAANLLLCAL
ncbi:MAG: hypothetical protein PCFJNLEI_02137 [Verrucomicrobiae bacterium]|nr:hypothetical protein [Verrucomicrobiae bacterium]